MEWTTESMLRHMLENPHSGREHKDSFILQDILPHAAYLPSRMIRLGHDVEEPVYFRTTARLVSRTGFDVSCECAVFEATATDTTPGRTLMTAVDGVDPLRTKVLGDILTVMIHAYSSHPQIFWADDRLEKLSWFIVEILDYIYVDSPTFLSNNNMTAVSPIILDDVPAMFTDIITDDSEVALDIRQTVRRLVRTGNRHGAVVFVSTLVSHMCNEYKETEHCDRPQIAWCDKRSLVACVERRVAAAINGTQEAELEEAAVVDRLAEYHVGTLNITEDYIELLLEIDKYDYRHAENYLLHQTSENFSRYIPTNVANRATAAMRAYVGENAEEAPVEGLYNNIVANASVPVAVGLNNVDNPIVVEIMKAIRNHRVKDILITMVVAAESATRWIGPLLNVLFANNAEPIRPVHFAVYMCWLLSKTETATAIARAGLLPDLPQKLVPIASKALVQHALWTRVYVCERQTPTNPEIPVRLVRFMEHNAWCLGAYAWWYMNRVMNGGAGYVTRQITWCIAIAATQFSSELSLARINRFAAALPAMPRETIVAVLQQGRVESLPWLFGSPAASSLIMYGLAPLLQKLLRMYPNLPVRRIVPQASIAAAGGARPPIWRSLDLVDRPYSHYNTQNAAVPVNFDIHHGARAGDSLRDDVDGILGLDDAPLDDAPLDDAPLDDID